MRRSNAEIVLRALQRGVQPIEVGDLQLVMSEDGRVGTPLWDEKGNQIGEMAILDDLSLNWFLRACNELTADQIFGIAASLTMQSMKELRYADDT